MTTPPPVFARWVLGLCLGGLGLGCADDQCKNAPPSFQLAVSIMDPTLAAKGEALEVIITVNEDTWRRRYPLGTTLSDQTTSLAVEFDPAPSGTFQLTVEVTLLDADGSTLAGGAAVRNASSDGCNQVELMLRETQLDGGVSDVGPVDVGDASDAGDIGFADDGGGPTDAMPSDTSLPDATREDGSFPGDTGTSSTAWFPWAVTSTPSESACSGPSYVRWNGRYRKWIAAILCSSQSYKLKMGEAPGGPYHSIGDSNGGGEDHCELVDPAFVEPCAVCSLGSQTTSPGSDGGYFRSNAGEDFVLSFDLWGMSYYTALSYECGVSIP